RSKDANKLQKLKSFRGCEHQTLSKFVSEREDVLEVHIRVDKEEERKYNVAVKAVVLFTKNVRKFILLIKAWSGY
ncbi:hypothetical protein A2U01_0054446, partial [Trifolium medium]|nr:hypothetical protein [Trifolium medium]